MRLGSLSEDDLPGVAEVLSGLSGALVAAGLQADHTLAGSQLVLREVAPVLVGRLGP